jgi:hypothetical protein
MTRNKKRQVNGVYPRPIIPTTFRQRLSTEKRYKEAQKLIKEIFEEKRN